MLGAIIGDIVGSKYEFNNTFDYDFEMFGEGCDFTDDTICTVAVADAILNGRSYQESLLDWCRRYPSPKGAYGGRFAQWIRSLDPQPYNSFGNGSAMRVSPVAWLFDDLSQVLEEAEKTALPTHNHPEGIKGAKAVAHAIWHFRKSRFSEESKECKDKNSKESDDKAMKAFKDIARSYYEDFDTRDYHSDTIGAIVGSIAEARFGIPQEIKEKAISFLPDDMKDVLKQFAGKCEIKPQ